MPGSRAALAAVLVVVALALGASAGEATYTGESQTTTLGPPAVGAGLIVVPVLYAHSDPGTIDGTPSYNSDTSLSVAKLTGSRNIVFATDAAPLSTLPFPSRPGVEIGDAGGPALVAPVGAHLVAVWASTDDNGEIVAATLNAHGTPTGRIDIPATPTYYVVALLTGPDGAYAVQWRDASGVHADIVPAGQSAFTPLLGPGATLAGGQSLLLAGGDQAWLVSRTATATMAAPVTIGQDTTPVAQPVAAGPPATTLADGNGGLLILADTASGWQLVHVDHSGNVLFAPLPAGASDPELALDGANALVAYRGAGCRVYLERMPEATPTTSAHAIALSRGRCARPAGLAVDQHSGTAYVLLSSSRGTTLATVSANRVSTWHGELGGSVVAIVPAGSGQMLVESSGAVQDEGEQCGGADDSTQTRYTVRIFRGIKDERSGSLYETDANC